MTDFFDRVRQIKGDMSNAAFAKRCGLSLPNVASILRGSMPSADKAGMIATGCGVSLDWLMNGQEMYLQNKEIVQVPYYDVRASAGTGQLVEAEDLRGEISFRREWLRKYVQRVENVGIIQVEGDSMKKPNGDGMDDGDLLLVDNSIQNFIRAGVYVLEINGYLLVKRLEMLVSGGLEVKSDNPDYSDQTIDAASVDSLRILGKVFHHMRPIR